jgi:hypothetical protein
MLVALAMGLGIVACGAKPENPQRRGGSAPVDPAQAEAEAMSRELVDVLDWVVAYKSAHQGRIPTSLRQAGLDSLSPEYVRRVGRDGRLPVITIAQRRPRGHQVASCTASSQILEDRVLRDGTYELPCAMVSGGGRTFVIPASAAKPQ